MRLIPWSLSNITFIFCLAAFTVILMWIRLSGLTVSPPGFYKDEAGMTVSGYSVLTTGRDEFGIPLPLFFRSFDDWKEPIFIYSQIPFLLIYGEDIIATRLTSAWWGLLTIGLFSLLIWLRFKQKRYILLGILFLGFMPWHYHFSRIGFQLITLPFFFVAYLLLFENFCATKKTTWLFLASGVLGLWFYTYYSGRLLAFIYLLLQFWILKERLRFKHIIVNGLIFSLVLVPAFLWNLMYPETITSRYNAVSILSYGKDFLQTAEIYINGYVAHFDPYFWFMEGATNLRHSPMFHYPLLWISAPLVALGMYRLYCQRKEPLPRMILATLITFPVASAFTTNAPHVHRIIQMMPVAAYLMLLGWQQGEEAYRWLSSRYAASVVKFCGIGLVLVFLGGYAVEWNTFITFYYTKYPQMAYLWFQVPDIESIKALLTYPHPHHVSATIGEYRKATYQLVSKMAPQDMQKDKGVVDFFDPKALTVPRSGYYLLAPDECDSFAYRFSQAKNIESLQNGYCIYQIK